MHLRHLFSSRLRGSLLLGSLLVVSSFSTQAAEEMLRKAVGKGAYEMAYSQQENALWLATSQSRKLDKGGVVYRLDPVTLEVTQAIHNDLKPFGATINNTTQTLWFGNTVNSAVTAIDAKTGEVKGRLVLDDRKRTEEVRPLQPRELVADDATNTVYISGIGKESVIWVFALAALTIVGTMNMIGVKWFAEMEFWFALIKVLAIVTFLVVGTVFLGSGQPLDGNTTGFHLITDNGGFFPHGLLPALVLIQGVVFAFASIEMVGTAAGECKDPQTMVPKAINSVIWRIGLFYVGSVVLLVMLLPWSAYQAGQSPFVTFFSKLGVPYIGSIMNIVVLTAALSSLNSGLYCTGRILRSMAMGGSAPSFMAKMSRQHVPYAGILATLVVYVVGVFLNYLVPSRVFEIVLNFASLGIIASWAFIIVCQMRLRKAIKEGKAADVSFKLPGAPFTSWLTLLFLLSVLVLMAFDYPNGTYTIAALPIIGILLVIGWFGVRKRVAEIHSTAPVVEEDEEKQEIVFKPETAS
jgi:L-asparagine permease